MSAAVAASRIGLHGQSSLVLLYTREGKLRQRIMPVRGFGGVAPTDASDAARLLMRKHADVLSERHVSFTQVALTALRRPRRRRRHVR